MTDRRISEKYLDNKPTNQPLAMRKVDNLSGLFPANLALGQHTKSQDLRRTFTKNGLESTTSFSRKGLGDDRLICPTLDAIKVPLASGGTVRRNSVFFNNEPLRRRSSVTVSTFPHYNQANFGEDPDRLTQKGFNFVLSLSRLVKKIETFYALRWLQVLIRLLSIGLVIASLFFVPAEYRAAAILMAVYLLANAVIIIYEFQYVRNFFARWFSPRFISQSYLDSNIGIWSLFFSQL